MTIPNVETDTQSNTQCLNCGAELNGAFCHQCGQRHRQERLKVWSILADIPKQLFSLEKGLLYTFVEQFKAPGTVAKRYVAGERVKFINPLTYFIVAGAVQIILLFIEGDVIRQQVLEQTDNDPVAQENLITALGENAAQKYSDIYLSLMNQAYTYMAFLFMCLPYAFFLRLYSKKHREAYNGAETLVFSMFTMAHVILLTGLLGFITLQISIILHGPLSLSLYLIFSILSVRGFYAGEKRSALAGIFALITAVLLFFLSLMIAAGIAIAMAQQNSTLV